MLMHQHVLNSLLLLGAPLGTARLYAQSGLGPTIIQLSCFLVRIRFGDLFFDASGEMEHNTPVACSTVGAFTCVQGCGGGVVGGGGIGTSFPVVVVIRPASNTNMRPCTQEEGHQSMKCTLGQKHLPSRSLALRGIRLLASTRCE